MSTHEYDDTAADVAPSAVAQNPTSTVTRPPAALDA
jgi:hypothetical protein